MKKKFVVDRSHWQTATHKHWFYKNTLLLNNGDFRCCLGFVCSQCGIPDEHLCGGIDDEEGNLLAGSAAFATPSLVVGRYEEERERIGFLLDEKGLSNNQFTLRAMQINDDKSIDNETRECRLKELFESHGYELEFEGEYGNGR